MLERYERRQASWAASRDVERGASARVARLRLATFLAVVAGLTWALGFDGGALAFALTGILLLMFAVLVVMHARIEERAEWYEALREVNARGVARIHRHWDALPDASPPHGLDIAQHAYAVDLDLFGHASAFQLIGPAATPGGNSRLAAWLLAPAAPAEIVARQEAAGELAALDDWCEHLSALGVPSQASQRPSLDTFLAWAEGVERPLPLYAALRGAVYVLTLSLWGLLALDLSGLLPNSLWTIPLLLGIILSFVTAPGVSRAFNRAGSGERTLSRHTRVLAHVLAQPFRSPLLAALQGRLTARGRSAPAAMRALTRMLAFADLRHGSALLHFPIQALTLWDFHCLFAIERWRHRTGAGVRAWFDAASEVDAVACLGTVRRDNPTWTFPVFTTEGRLAATSLGHPLLPGSRRVTNDVEIGPRGTVLLVTGSNMSGKSTLLRAVGLNAVLAQTGAAVCADAFRLPPCDVQTSIRIQDSLERGVSYFMAALARLKGVVDAAERDAADRVLLYLLDEILQGTNSAERGIAVQAVARHLLNADAIGVMTTHDLNLASEEPLRSAAHLVHFTETVDEQGTMRFDYRLREGLATSRNALRLMELIGITVAQP